MQVERRAHEHSNVAGQNVRLAGRVRSADRPTVAPLLTAFILAIALLVVPLLAPGNAQARVRPAAQTHPRFGAPPPVTGGGAPKRLVSTSSNWAGYDAVGGTFTSVTATWVQPTIQPSLTTAYADFWVGLDGDGSTTVEQIGTEGYSLGGVVTYDAWYEMYPNYPVNIPMTITPGDLITATVTSTAANKFVLSLVDQTSGQSFTTRQTFAGAQLASAEVIVEAPYADGVGVLPLADFGAVNFTNCVLNGQPIAAFTWQQINMVTETGSLLARTSALGPDGASFSVTTDTTPPTTTARGLDNRWHHKPVTVTFSATDNPGGSGVAYTEYSLDDGTTWTKGTSVTIPAPADHSNDGSHVILYRSADRAGNIEPIRRGMVRIDTRKPTPIANWATSVVRGRVASLRYYVSDRRPGSPTATVTIKVTTLAGASVKTVLLRQQPVNTRLSFKFACWLARGKYRFLIFATDAAGNPQTRPASNRLTVR